jgi:hypothetical protein
VSTTGSQLHRLAKDLGIVEAFEHGYRRGGLAASTEGEMERQARRVIYPAGNRQINKFARAVGLGPSRR